MRQALHIFKKDIRYLKYDLVLVVTLEVIFCWMASRHIDTWWVEFLLPVAASYLIVRLIHAEVIPGETQFWITRPYRWKSLAASKLLFIVVFIQLPIFVTQLVILMVEGFPLGDTLGGLVWTQVLLVFVVWLPLAALAAMTSGTVPLLFSVLTLAAVVFGAQQLIILSRVMLRWRQHAALWPESVDWIRTSVVVATLVTIAIPVLYFQYRSRHSRLSRTYAIAAAGVALLTYLFLPCEPALAIQSLLSKEPAAGAPLRIALGAPFKSQLGGHGWGDDVNMYLPIALTGIREGHTVRADALSVTIETAGGKTWKSGVTGVNYMSGSANAANFAGTVPVDRDFFNANRTQPVTIRARFYLSLFGNRKSKTLALGKSPVNVMDGLQCYLGDAFDHVYCRSAFRWPDRLVYSQTTVKNSLYELISYSPFPSGISMNDAIEIHWADGPASSQATIVVEEPLAHLHRELELRGVRLATFAPRR